MKVLFVNHTAVVSGGEVSLMRLAEGLRAHGGVAVAVDAAVVPRSAWDDTRLEAGQRVELLAAMQGGA